MQIMSFDTVTFNISADVVRLAAMAIFYQSRVGAAKNEQSCQVAKWKQLISHILLTNVKLLG